MKNLSDVEMMAELEKRVREQIWHERVRSVLMVLACVFALAAVAVGASATAMCQ
jgi:hypothetical protein